MDYGQALKYAVKGVPVRRKTWPENRSVVAPVLDRDALRGQYRQDVVRLKQGSRTRRFKPTEEDLAAFDWTVMTARRGLHDARRDGGASDGSASDGAVIIEH